MYFILLFGLFTGAFIIERGIALYFKTKPTPPDFRKVLLDHIRVGDLIGAERYAGSHAATTALGRVAQVGCRLRSHSAGDEEVQARMDEALSQEIAKIDRRTGFLAMFGNVATLLGLLGTISGMIIAFAAVATASPADRARLLSMGISEAMNCTAFGLLVAIPALVCYAVFQNRTDRLVGELTSATTEIYHDLLFLTEGDDTLRSKEASEADLAVKGRTPSVQPSLTQ